MKRWIKNWDELLPYERIFHILTLVFSVITILSAVLTLFKVIPLWAPMLGLAAIQFCQAIYSWRKQREIGIFGLCAGTVVLAEMVAMLFL